MSRTNWEADKMLDVYIHDYFVKRNLHATARAFQAESRVPRDTVAIDSPGGFLMEWWSVFWDIFVARANKKNSDSTASQVGQQSVTPQQQGKRHQQIPKQKHAHQQQLSKGTDSAISIKNIPLKRQKTASVNALTTKIYEEKLKLPPQMELIRPSDNMTNLLEPCQLHMFQTAAVSGPLSGKTIHGISGASSENLQQVHRSSQLKLGIRSELNSVAASRTTGFADPLSLMTGLDQGVSNLPLKGWPLTGVDQLQLRFSTQHKSLDNLQSHQHLMRQAHQTTSASASDLGGHSQRMLSYNGNWNNSLVRDLPNVASSLQSGSILSIEDMDTLIMQQLLSVNNQQQKLYLPNSHLMQQPLYQNNLMPQEQLNNGVMTADDSFPNALVGSDQAAENVIWPKRAQPVPVASPAKILDAANIHGPPSSSLSTLSAPVGRASCVTSKSLSMFGADALDSLKSPTMQSADMDNYVDNGSLEEYVGSPLSHDDVITGGGVGLNNHGKSCEGFSLKEIHLLSGGQSKIECSDFSSDGKFLVSCGYDNKATLWCTDSFALMSELEEHSLWVTDVRFSPSMPRLATSSADKTVRIWNIDHPGFSLRTFTGHSSRVMSLDFHPTRDDLVCSSDRDNEIRYWSIKSGRCSGVLKGGANRMRFQPRLGGFLAAASENVVSLLDVESQVCRQKLLGHKSTIHTLCWDLMGDHLASVSDDLVQVWAVGSNVKGELVHELNSSGKKFHSCIFHPTQRSVLIIGSYQTLELLDMKGEKRTTQHAHEELISCLAASNTKGLVASAGYDKCIKIWE